MTDGNKLLRALTPLQQSILEFLCNSGAASAERVREALAPAHPLKDSSVRTLLRRLEAQGHLRHRIEGQTYLYEAVVSPRTVAARAVGELIERFWAGSAEQFLAAMAAEKILSPAQLQRAAKRVSRRA